MEIIYAYSEGGMKHTNKIYGQNAELLNVIAYVTYVTVTPVL
jgi:hypothetical protein